MTEHKTMNTIIHAAVRRDLQRFDDALAAFRAPSQARADQLAAAWKNFEFQLHHHHQDEETIFWPALRELGADEALATDLGGEHARMLAALTVACDRMDSFRADPSVENAQAARAGVQELNTIVCEHLEHEERDLEPFAAEHSSSPQLRSAQKLVRQAHRGHTGTMFAWLLDGADADAAGALRREIPPPVLFLITRTAGRRYRRDIAPAWA